MYLNKAFIIGNLTRDPEVRSLPSGIQVTTFSLATNRVWRDKEGAKQESVEYHNIVVFGRQAETCGQYLKKGSSALVEGRLQTRSWEAEGQKKYRTEIVAERVQFGNRPTGESSQGSQGGYAPAAALGSAGAAASATPRAPKEDAIEYPEDDINPDDIPF